MWLQAPVCPRGYKPPDCQGWTLPFSSLLAVSQVQEPLPSMSGLLVSTHTMSLGRGAGTAGALGAEAVPCLHLALAVYLSVHGAVHLYGKGIFLYVYYTSIKGFKNRNPICDECCGQGRLSREWDIYTDRERSRGARQVQEQLWATVSTRHRKENRLTPLTSSRQERSFKIKAES